MQLRPALSIVTLAIAGIACGPSRAAAAAPAEAVASSPVHVRVFYLEAMTARDAAMLVRSQAHVRAMAVLEDRKAVVVRDVAEVVDKCESLLRERDAGLRVANPHGPVELEVPAGSPLDNRVFTTVDDGLPTVVVVLRAIYSIRSLNDRASDATVSVDATPQVLDAIEALLGELDLLFPTG